MVISRAAALTACYAGTLGTLQLANPRCRAYCLLRSRLFFRCAITL